MSDVVFRDDMWRDFNGEWDWEAIYGYPLPAGWASWDEYIANRASDDRWAEQLLTGQEP